MAFYILLKEIVGLEDGLGVMLGLEDGVGFTIEKLSYRYPINTHQHTIPQQTNKPTYATNNATQYSQ